ncbi:unnamed protein product [Microthlaspi erraticum]|uniref:Exonuclease domain-containing protein n=1 Tax=Microthlaspi erraticum TaxID=1685480 RepID=A0A6D2HCK1_9BRAS|nr:unnamed protein product [Microthlaspi erraticum]
MSDEWVAFFDFKEHESGNLQFGGMIVSSETLESIENITYYIPSDIDAFRKDSSTRRLKKPVTFLEISEEIYNMLNGKIWMGHDIIRRDIPRLRAEFIKISKEFPAPKTVIDTVLFTSSNSRLAKLSVFCGLGCTKQGSCKDCTINLNAIKECETIMKILKNKKRKRNDEDSFHPMLSLLMKSADETVRFNELMRGKKQFALSPKY